VLREGSGELIRQQVRSATDEKKSEIEKHAFLARFFRGLTNLPATELAAHGLKPLSTAAQEAVETSVRKGVAKHLAPKAMKASDSVLRSADDALTLLTRGESGVTPEFRRRVMEFVAKNPGAALGVAAPFPGSAVPGIAAAGALSSGAKKMFKIPTHSSISFKALGKELREQGYDDVMDYLVKTKAKYNIPKLTEDIALYSPARTSIF